MRRTLAVPLMLVAGVFMLSAPSVQAQDFCKGDFDYDGNVDADDVTIFLEHFGRSPLYNPCPSDGPAPVAWSGQMDSYAPGDDGDLERGVHWTVPRFQDNGDGTLTDKATGLIWLRDANCFGTRMWNEALSDCNSLSAGYCGLTDGSQVGDWRLPSIRELQSVIDYSQSDPAIGFLALLLIQNLQSYYYWSSTSLTTNPNVTVFRVDFTYGEVEFFFKDTYSYVWPVRDPL